MTEPTISRASFDFRTERSKELLQAVKELWENPKIRRRALTELYSQIAVAFGLVIGCYLVLMIASPSWEWSILLLGGITVGGIAMGGLFHDSNHRAVFSPIGLSRRFDYVLAWLSSDVVLGMSGYHWSRKHDHHHTETNILGLDGDLQIEPVLRLHPRSRFVRTCKYQHIYAWFLYTLMLIPLHFRGHRIALFGGKHGTYAIRRARGWELAGTLSGLVIFYAWALALPIWRFGLVALWGFLAIAAVVGFVYAVAFQLAHCVDLVAFPTVAEFEDSRKEGYVHQLETTANFCPNNWLLRWFLGGLTHQTEHHLFRKYPHPFYRYVAVTAEDWCKRYDLPYHVNPTLRSAVSSHFAHLREMGRQGLLTDMEMG